MKSIITAVVLLVAGGAIPVHAGTIDVSQVNFCSPSNVCWKGYAAGGNTDPSQQGMFLTHGFKSYSSNISNSIVFSLDGYNSGDEVQLSLDAWGNYSNLKVSLLSSNDGTNFSPMMSFNSTGVLATYSALFLQGFDYLKLVVSGTFCHCAGYNLTLQTVAQTPIPGALLMFLTALGGLGGFAWRRKSAGAAA